MMDRIYNFFSLRFENSINGVEIEHSPTCPKDLNLILALATSLMVSKKEREKE